jgi:hypothetical protein
MKIDMITLETAPNPIVTANSEAGKINTIEPIELEFGL